MLRVERAPRPSGTHHHASSFPIVVLLASALGTSACLATDEPEPVRFVAFQPELFAAGGALTDAWADFDGDGDPDRFVGFNGAASRLYRNDRLAGFVDVAAEVGLLVERAVRTSAWGDFDDDGDPDLLLGFAGDAPVTALYRNDGDAGFVNVAGDVNLELVAGTTRQASWIDFDEDGDLDLALAGAADDGMHYLMENLLQPEISWQSLQVRVLDADGHATRPGAEVRIYRAGSRTLLGTRLVDTGSGYDSQSDLPVHFGVPGGHPVDVEITILADGQRHVGLITA